MTTSSHRAPLLTGDPEADSRRAAELAGVEIRLMHDLDEVEAVSELLDQVWGTDKNGPPQMPVEQLRAMAHAGNYVAGVFENGRLIGAGVGFFGEPVGTSLHSHITGILAAGRGRNVGYALKLHQRAWALRTGLVEITWTFDPLVRRNAHFNLNKLGAVTRDYLVDFYGQTTDAINFGQGSDRLIVAWELLATPSGREGSDAGDLPSVIRFEGAFPVFWPHDHENFLVPVPPDIEDIRSKDPEVGRAWRLAVRTAMEGIRTGNHAIIGLSSTGEYILRRTHS